VHLVAWMPIVRIVLLQVAAALAYYVGLVLLFRLAGKRMAGQTTTFDFIVLIALAVVLQNLALRPGLVPGVVFVATVFAAHRLTAYACARSPRFCSLVRGAARPLIRNGVVDRRALASENLTLDELLAGLRKLGIERPEDVKLAALEETGHISAVPRA
jgi:uncharacterized membrane protein YcaP (DUF421 family)